MSNIVRTQFRQRPEKPFPSFPLTPHANDQWCKKIAGVVRYFGTWGDPQGALEEYNRQAADLHLGRAPGRRHSTEPTIKEIGNDFLAAQQEKACRGLITPAWFKDCLHGVKQFVDAAGRTLRWNDLRPSDFRGYRMRLYDRYGVHSINRHITIVRGMFNHAYETEVIESPVKYGGQFKKPSAKEKRQSRGKAERENGKRLFTPAEIRKLIKTANQPLKTMILLGINGGFGNTDCAE